MVKVEVKECGSAKPMDKKVLDVNNMIHALNCTQFYGKLEINFKNGKITHCKKTESIEL